MFYFSNVVLVLAGCHNYNFCSVSLSSLKAQLYFTLVILSNLTHKKGLLCSCSISGILFQLTVDDKSFVLYMIYIFIKRKYDFFQLVFGIEYERDSEIWNYLQVKLSFRQSWAHTTNVATIKHSSFKAILLFSNFRMSQKHNMFSRFLKR